LEGGVIRRLLAAIAGHLPASTEVSSALAGMLMQPEKKQKEFDMKPKTRSIAVAISVILIAVAFKAVPAMAQEITGAPRAC
jgi:hypothetical protein